MDDKKFDFSDPMTIMAIVSAGAGDIFFLIFVLGIAVPAFGLVFGIYGFALHYVAAFLVTFLLWKKFKGLLTKLVVVVLFLLPLPTLSIGVFLGVLLSNKMIRFIAEQAAIVAVGAATGGTGAVAGEAAVAARGTQAAVQIGEAAATVGRVAEVGAVAARGAAIGEEVSVAAQQGVQIARGAGAAQRIAQTGEQASAGSAGKISETGPFKETKMKPPETFEEKIKRRAQDELEKRIPKKPEEIVQKAFKKMEEMSEDEDEDEEDDLHIGNVVDLSTGQRVTDEDGNSDENVFRRAA